MPRSFGTGAVIFPRERHFHCLLFVTRGTPVCDKEISSISSRLMHSNIILFHIVAIISVLSMVRGMPIFIS